ncbi:MAG: GIY-YIG nuclease family protein [Chitinophagales bacterium]|nr:GIY-YIG nuclease family protein [Chitinophagales bacterium]
MISILDLVKGTNNTKFYEPLTNNRYKVYIIKSKDKVLYIGATKSSIRRRLYEGLRAKGVGGYSGYKWKNYSSVILFVYTFNNLVKLEAESIEAELVYLFREKTGYWPECQNEIHFNNEYSNGKLIAKKIYDQISKTKY